MMNPIECVNAMSDSVLVKGLTNDESAREIQGTIVTVSMVYDAEGYPEGPVALVSTDDGIEECWPGDLTFG